MGGSRPSQPLNGCKEGGKENNLQQKQVFLMLRFSTIL